MQTLISTGQKRAVTLQMLQQGAPEVDAKIAADAALGRDIVYAPAPAAAPVQHVVLTGATGFLGVHVLAALLQSGGPRVTCLTRGRDDAEAEARVLAALKDTGAPIANLSRLRVLAHDLSRSLQDTPGLLPRIAQADTIINCAARVNFTDRYMQARGANVLSVRHLLHLASLGMRMHHVSTVAVFSPAAFAGAEVTEDTPPRIAAFGAAQGYAQTKLAAELMLQEAAENGLQTTIYRPGLIGWDSRTGHGNHADFLTHFITGSIRVGALPDIGIRLSIAPVDYVAGAIVGTALQGGADIPALHLVGESALSMADLAQHLTAAGPPVARVPYEDWLARIDADAQSPLRPLALLLPPNFPDDPAARVPSLLDGMAADSGPHLSDHQTRAGLPGTGVPGTGGDLNFSTFLKRATT
ncbi:SDR family oxidoreductase [Thalassococcus sp. BH17M4-6]|uniref:SDR family oxidoreductase n=1 Tax=Thalassococcus sp. BH17M4-6 TaxID=3413148 RepID=UPI003BD462CA